MSEQIITIIFFALCLGQVWALGRSRLTAVLYYISVASLPYFSFWLGVTWDSARVCGAILILGGIMRYRQHRRIALWNSPWFVLFFSYMVILTIVSSMFWPVESMSGRSAAYGPLRAYVQVFNWLIMAGVAWQIALALSQNGALEKARRWLIGLGMFHCSVGLYQVVAFWTGLPLTGIRRVAVGVGLDSSAPHVAIASLGGIPIFRPTSFAGEPRSLAAISLLWIAALLTIYVQGQLNRRTLTALSVSLLVLALTLSTSGWGGFFCCLGLLAFITVTRRKSRSKMLFVIAALVAIFMTIDSTGLLPAKISLRSVFEQRWTTRVQDPFADMAVQETLKVLRANPHFYVIGTGAGGMSFYIAENRQGSDVILASTVSLICVLGDLGLIGLFLMIMVMSGGIKILLFQGSTCDDTCRFLAFMGCVCFCQYMISAPSWMLAAAFGFSLAAVFRSKAIVRARIAIRNKPIAKTGAELPCK